MISIIGTGSIVVFVGLFFFGSTRESRPIILGLLFWLALLTVFGTTTFFENHARSFPPLPIKLAIMLLLVLGSSLLISKISNLWETIPTKTLISWHFVRVPIGLCFVWAAATGKLAPEFGERAGWGDMVAGVFALACIFITSSNNHKLIQGWNVIGLIDLALAVGTALLTVSSPIQVYPDADRMRLMNELPFSLIPAFFVPVLVFTHFLILKRFWHGRTSNS